MSPSPLPADDQDRVEPRPAPASLAPLANWSYPFKARGGQDVHDPSLYAQALAHAQGGTYLLGSNGLWHGGIHFDDGTAAYLDQSRVHCIADGEVVAYRIDERVVANPSASGLAAQEKDYATSFVLVRHRLEAPRLVGNPASPPSLVFFSLYMHLLDWASYEQRSSLERPAFWENDRYRVRTQGGVLNVRSQPNPHAPVQAELRNGTPVRIAGEGPWRQLTHLLGTGYTLLPGRPQPSLGYVAQRFLEPEATPRAFDRVVVLDTPCPIKAGTLIGHPGHYLGRQQLHLETFSCEDLPAFIAASRAWALQLPDSEKTLLKIHAGASKLIAHRPDIDAQHPPRPSDPGVQVGVDLILPQAQLDALPATDHLTVPARTEGGISLPEQHWWHLKGLLADSEGNPIDGWLCEQELITSRHTYWDFTDFTLIESKTSYKSMLAYQLKNQGVLAEHEKNELQHFLWEGSQDPIRTCFNKISRSHQSRDLCSRDLHASLAAEWQQQKAQRIIAKHESEWLFRSNTWGELDRIMSPEDKGPNARWEREKTLIENLCWWNNKLASLLNGAEDAWHFHPVAFLNVHRRSIQEVRIRAFMRMIRVGEGTTGRSGYEKLFGGQSFIKDYGKTFEDHPAIKVKKGKYTSSAAGAYQVMAYTWNDQGMLKLRKRLKIADFSPESQDRFCVAIIRYKLRENPLKLIADGKIEDAIRRCSTEWASLPTSPYGQPVETMEDALKNYAIFFEEECEGCTDLYIKNGFLGDYP